MQHKSAGLSVAQWFRVITDIPALINPEPYMMLSVQYKGGCDCAKIFITV